MVDFVGYLKDFLKNYLNCKTIKKERIKTLRDRLPETLYFPKILKRKKKI